LCAAVVCWSAAAPAEPTASSPSELLDAARRAEAEGAFPKAVALYGSVVEAAPQSRQARHARRRKRYLQARSGGDFGPLQKLTAMRRGPASREALDAFARDVLGFPEGANRRESWQLLGDAYLRQHDDPRAALAAYRAWLDSPNLPESERLLAVSGAALARAELEGAAPSLNDMNQHDLGHRAEAITLRAEVVGQWGRPIAWLLLLGFAATGLGLTGGRGLKLSALRPTILPPRIAAAAWLLGLPLAFVFRYDHRFAPQFAWLVCALLSVVVIATVVSAGRPATRHRLPLAGFAVVATVAAAFLAADHSEMLLDVMLAVDQRPT